MSPWVWRVCCFYLPGTVFLPVRTAGFSCACLHLHPHRAREPSLPVRPPEPGFRVEQSAGRLSTHSELQGQALLPNTCFSASEGPHGLSVLFSVHFQIQFPLPEIKEPRSPHALQSQSSYVFSRTWRTDSSPSFLMDHCDLDYFCFCCSDGVSTFPFIFPFLVMVT